MPEQLFEVGSGISLNGEVSILFGPAAPAGTEADAANPGSKWYSTAGVEYLKDANGNWVEGSKTRLPTVTNNVVAKTQVDSVPVAECNTFIWSVEAYSGSKSYQALVSVSSNGAEVDWNRSSIVFAGGRIAGLGIDVSLDNGNVVLSGEAGIATTFVIRRLMQDKTSGQSASTGGTGGGTGDVTAAQLADGLATKVNTSTYTQGIADLQAALATKGDSAYMNNVGTLLDATVLRVAALEAGGGGGGGGTGDVTAAQLAAALEAVRVATVFNLNFTQGGAVLVGASPRAFWLAPMDCEFTHIESGFAAGTCTDNSTKVMLYNTTQNQPVAYFSVDQETQTLVNPSVTAGDSLALVVVTDTIGINTNTGAASGMGDLSANAFYVRAA